MWSSHSSEFDWWMDWSSSIYRLQTWETVRTSSLIPSCPGWNVYSSDCNCTTRLLTTGSERKERLLLILPIVAPEITALAAPPQGLTKQSNNRADHRQILVPQRRPVQTRQIIRVCVHGRITLPVFLHVTDQEDAVCYRLLHHSALSNTVTAQLRRWQTGRTTQDVP